MDKRLGLSTGAVRVARPVSLVAFVEDIVERAKQREKREPLPGAPLPSNVVHLPLWPEPVRVIPNGFLRSALFGALAKGKKRSIDGELAAIDGVTIRYKGQHLGQGDLDVWLSVLHAVRLQELGSQCRVTSYALLKLMGKTDTGKNRKTLHTRIERLVAGALTVKQGRYAYIGSLISGAAKDEKTQEWVIDLDAKLFPLFAKDQFTQVEWAARHALGGKPLAQWLHGFYASHAKPYPMKVETLHRLCGSETGELWKFAQTLSKALDAVKEASKGFSYEIRGNLVHITKNACGAQRRHLAKKAAKSKRPRS